MRKVLLSWAVVLALGLSVVAVQVAAAQEGSPNSGPIRVVQNGQVMQLSHPPIWQQGQVSLPVTELGAPLGVYSIQRLEGGRRVVLHTPRGVVDLTAGNGTALIGRRHETVSPAPLEQQDELYLPLSFIHPAFDVTATWDAGTRTVTLSAPPMAQAGVPKGFRAVPGGSLEINGRRIALSVPLAMVGREVMVPAHPVLSQLGASAWKQSTTRATAGLRGQKISLTVGNRTAFFGNRRLRLAQAPFLYQNEFYVPLSFLSTTTGARVAWHDDTKLATIDTGQRTARAGG